MALFDIEQIAQSLSAARREWRDAHNRLQDAGEREFPSRDAVAKAVATGSDDDRYTLFKERLQGVV